MNQLEQQVADEIRRRGPIPFSEVMDAALYDPAFGFYAAGGAAGRRGDFLTSPEVGPLFGAVVARAMDEWWRERGAPDPFVVVEAGAGAGTLAVSVLAAKPTCAAALRYVLVERSPALRRRQAEHLVLEDPALAFAPDRDEDEDGEVCAPRLATGPIVVSLDSLPRVQGGAVVFANELLDNMPFDILERRDDCWLEVRVGLEDGALVERLVPYDDGLPVEDVDALEHFDGARIPIQRTANRWLREARSLGSVVALDYASTTPEMAARPSSGWLRTYRGHQRGSAPLDDLGSQDITCDVAVDQLAPPTRVTTQAEWLHRYGIDELVEDGRRVWEQRKHVGDLESIRARSRVNEADALADPAGLGAFHVLEWLQPPSRL